MQRLLQHKPNPKPVHSCTVVGCKATFRKKWRLQEHLGKHTGQKPFRCEVGCGKVFAQRSKLRQHREKHLGVKKYVCPTPECRTAFVTKQSLTRHQKLKHGTTPPLKCSVLGCSKTFHKKKALKNHISQHKGEPQFVCDHPGCEWKGYSSAGLSAHRRRHTGYCCPFPGCQVKSTTWTALQQHRKKHPLDLKCQTCKKTFTKGGTLQRHKLTHLDRKVSLICPREDCKQEFTTVFNLTHHIRKNHLCLQPYHCYHAGCNRTFAMRESLIRHLVVHDPTKKKMKLKFTRKPSKRSLRGHHRLLPVVEQDLSRLFNQKLGFRSKTLLESNLSILFNERQLRDTAEPEANLTSLFHLPPVRVRIERAPNGLPHSRQL